MNTIDNLLVVIRRMEKKVPKTYGNNDYWTGYKEAIYELWKEVEALEAEVNQ